MIFRTFHRLALFFVLSIGYISLNQAATATTATAVVTSTTTTTTSSSCLGGVSTGFKLSGAITHSKTFTPTVLSKYQTSKMTVSYYSGKDGLVTKTFIGVPLIDLLNEAVVVTDSTRKNDALRKYLVATATDCYQVIIALAEIQPATGGQQAMVAFETVDETGTIQPLDDTEGEVKLIMPGDKTGGRDMFHLNSIVVRSAP